MPHLLRIKMKKRRLIIKTMSVTEKLPSTLLFDYIIIFALPVVQLFHALQLIPGMSLITGIHDH